MMVKFFVSVLVFLALWANIAFAQEDDINDPDEAGVAMPNVGIIEAESIVEIIEGVGTVLFSNVAFRTAPGTEGELIRYAAQGERVLLIGESGEWLKVQMYTNAEAFIHKKYVRTNKIARDERTTLNNMNKHTSIIIGDIINRFNETLKNSSFAKKYKIIPYFNVVDERKIKNKMAITFVYSCVDLDNKMIPSYNENLLRHEMLGLLQVIFSKLLLTDTESYELIIKVPVFNENGEVKDLSKIYSTITLDAKDVDMKVFKEDESKIWLYVKPSIPINDLFKRYP